MCNGLFKPLLLWYDTQTKPNQTDKKKLDLIVWGSFHEYCFLDDYDDDAMANMY